MTRFLPTDGDLFTAKPMQLDGLLRGIRDHTVALPDFQRPWVWEPEMVKDLLISVAYRYPAGSLLTMPVSAEGFALRPFEGSGDTLHATPHTMVLDGQQRLTSLFQSLMSPSGVQHKGRRHYFYLDVPHLMSDPDGIDVGDPYFDQALFHVQLEKDGRRARYDGLQVKYELTTDADEMAAGALPLRHVFGDGDLGKWKETYLTGLAGDSMTEYIRLSQTWDNLVQPWITRIRSYPFPVIELRRDMPLSAICYVFEKVNSTGKPLDVFDLCTAILWAQGFHLNREWEAAAKDLASALPMISLTQFGTAFLMSLSLLNTIDQRRARPDDNIAVRCRRDDLMAMRAPDVQRLWPQLLEGYRLAGQFMTNQGILSERILPYTTLIVPLAAILADVKRRLGDVRLGAATPKIEQWFWCSVFSQRYSSMVETNSASDFDHVLRWIDGGNPPDVVRAFSFRSDQLQEVSSIRNAIYRGVLCLLARNGARDFGGGGKLSTALFYDTRQDHHHIFPKNALTRMVKWTPTGDTLVNRTLISAAVNRSIGGRSPSQYVAHLREQLGGGTFDEILRSHLIDPNILASDDPDAFYLNRREQIRDLVASTCGGQVLPFSDTPGMPEAADEFDATGG